MITNAVELEQLRELDHGSKMMLTPYHAIDAYPAIRVWFNLPKGTLVFDGKGTRRLV